MKKCNCSCHNKKGFWAFARKQNEGCTLCTDWFNTKWHNGNPTRVYLKDEYYDLDDGNLDNSLIMKYIPRKGKTHVWKRYGEK